MPILFPYEGLILNMKQELPKNHPAYLSVDEAYQMLKQDTGQDFGYDIDAWEEWLTDQNQVIDSKHYGGLLLILNQKQELPPYLTGYSNKKEEALETLKKWTGQDFGYDVAAWEKWLLDHKRNINS